MGPDETRYLAELGIDPRDVSVQRRDGCTYATVIHQGARVAYKVAEIAFAWEQRDHPLAQLVVRSTWAPATRKRRSQVLSILKLDGVLPLSADTKVNELVSSGWLSTWTEFSERGTSRGETLYRLGPAVSVARERQKQRERDRAGLELERIRAAVAPLQNPHSHPMFDALRAECLADSDIELDVRHFLAAVLTVASHLDVFDWREIGAHYRLTDARWPSKQFDSRKEALLAWLNQRLGNEVSKIGLDSLPGMSVVFFAGDLTVKIPGHPDRPYVHTPWPEALTGALFEERRAWIAHAAHTVIAVENRAVLRRLARHYRGPNRSQLIFCAYEGQVRSSHYGFLDALARGGASRLLIWGDWDSYALSMLDRLRSLPFKTHEVIVPPGVRVSFDKGRELLASAAASDLDLYEQERDIGLSSAWYNLFGQPEACGGEGL